MAHDERASSTISNKQTYMADLELRKAADEANRCFSRLKARLRQDGTQVRGDTDYKTIGGLSFTASVLRDEWLEAMATVDRLAGSPSQVELPTMGREVANPLGLFINHRYRRISEDPAEAIEYLFRTYNVADDLYSFWSDEKGGLRGGTKWVQENFDLVNAPEFDPKIPQEDPAISAALEWDETDTGRLLVKRVGPERFAELVSSDSSKTLAKKSPTAKSIEIISDVAYVVTAVFNASGDEGEAKVFLTPCRPAEADETGEGFFKCDKIRYKLGEAENRLVVKIASVEAIVEHQDTGAANQADPLEWCRSMIERGFVMFKGDEKVFELAPRSFEALRAQVAPSLDPEIETLFVAELDMTVYRAIGGSEIDGYEEIAPEAAEESAAAVVDGSETEPEKPADGEAEPVPPVADVEDTGDFELVGYVYEPDLEYTTSFVEEIDGIQVSVQVKLDHLSEGKRSLFCLSGLSGEIHGKTFTAFSVDSFSFSASRKSMVEKSIELVQSLKPATAE